MMTAKEVYDILNKENLIKESNIKDVINMIEYVSYDSRDVKANTLFFCKGMNYKKEYLGLAISAGATMYISEQKYEGIDIGYIVVTDVRKAMALVGLEFYNYAFKELTSIGITGTKGKTTVTCFLKNILDEYTSSKNAMISTVETYTGKRQEESHLTTPEPTELQKFFREAVDSNIKYLVMEVASQAYKTGRVYGVDFNYGMFLNISEDHISDVEHSSYEDYLNCKLQLIKHTKNMVLNKNTDDFDAIMAVCKSEKVNITTYGTDNTADFYFDQIEKKEKGFAFTVKNNSGYEKSFEISIEGRFNIENALAAITMSKVMGIDDESIQRGLIRTKIQGRMNIFEKDGITVIVDYAHNKLSFTKLYESIKLDYIGRRVISLGGGPGGKAYARRKDFGTIVGSNSDYIYLTAEDPQFEKVKDICGFIAGYIEKGKYEIVEDRKEAILKALENAKRGDVIVLLAKGEELYQKVEGTFIPYESDLELAKEWAST